MEASADVIITGAGPAGLLSLQHLSRVFPSWTFILIERESWIGGRLRPTLRDEGSWSCGLQGVGADLFDYLVKTLQLPADPSQSGLLKPAERVGVMSGQKVASVPWSQLAGPELAKILGGTAAIREWPLVDELLKRPLTAETESDQAFGQAWKGDRKSAALAVLEHLAHLWGLPELNTGSTRVLQAQAQLYARGQWRGRWDSLFQPLLEELQASDRLRLLTDAQIMAARYTDKVWTVASTRGTFQAPRMVVAQSPWEALAWLPKDLWPNPLLNLSGKTKPVSIVVLSDAVAHGGSELPDTLLIPAEEVQVISEAGQITYQATLNFELTVQAPAVVKAVKRLKRAKKKLHAAFTDLPPGSEIDHIALLPVGWAHTSSPQEQRWFDKIDSAGVQKPHLGFCGDAYGSQSTSDGNLIASVEALWTVWQQKFS